jgi:hypothetical protein
VQNIHRLLIRDVLLIGGRIIEYQQVGWGEDRATV